MLKLDRRRFLESTFTGGLAASLGTIWTGQELFAKDDRLAEQIREPYDSLFLTWQESPTTTSCIQWIGESAQQAHSISFAKLDETVWQTAKAFEKPFPDTDLRVFRCHLTDLSPGTEYKFRINDETREYRFRTMPEKATDEFRFISGGDAGTGSSALRTNQRAASQDPYFVVIGGDLAYDNGRSPKTFLKFLQNYHSTMVDSAGRLIPMLSCPGNHEVQGGYNAKREMGGSYLSVFDGLFSQTTYNVLDFGDYLSLVLLDTGHFAQITGEQTDWLEKRLKEREDHPHVFALNHIPCYPAVREPKLLAGIEGTGGVQRRYWCPLFERYNVNLVLEHHDHAFKRSHPMLDGLIDKQGVLYLGDGSWGKLRSPASPEKRPYLAKVSEDYHITVHQLEGDRRIHAAITDDGRIADLVSTVSKRAAR